MIDEELVKKDRTYYENPLKRLLNRIIVLLLKFIAILPFWVIFGISDFMYFLIRYVVRYRYKVIMDNLYHAFPEKSEKERKQITWKFYRHLCDFSLESIKMYGMSTKEMEGRLSVKNIDLINAVADRKDSAIVLGFHYNNWEWCSSIQTFSRHQLLMIYNPLRGNQAMEKFITWSREKWGGIGIPVHKSARVVLEYANRHEPTVLWLAADQTAPQNSKFWTYFLNREAPFFSGPEKIAIKTNQPVFLFHVKKVGRGRYEATVVSLVEEPKKLESKDILLLYIRKMEEIIRETPEYYLWSHRRWKHKRPEGIELTV